MLSGEDVGLVSLGTTALFREILVCCWLSWAWWRGGLEIFADSTTDEDLRDYADNLRGRFEEFVAMPQPFAIRYHRHGKFAGRAVRLIESVSGSGGIWTCVTPSFTVTTIKLGARSSVSTRPMSGVTYQGAPTLDADGKTRQASAARR